MESLHYYLIRFSGSLRLVRILSARFAGQWLGADPASSHCWMRCESDSPDEQQMRRHYEDHTWTGEASQRAGNLAKGRCEFEAGEIGEEVVSADR